MAKGLVALVLSVLILSFSATVYAQEIYTSILLRHCRAPMFIQLSDQAYLSGETDVESGVPQLEKPPLSNGRIAREILVGGVGALAVTIISHPLLESFDDPRPGYEVKRPFLALSTFLLVTAGSTLGSACGVYIVGNIGNETGSFRATLGGSAIGAGAFFVWLATGHPWSPSLDLRALIACILAPPIGATIGFNLTRRYDSPPAESETALINVRNGRMSLAVPRVHFRIDSFGRGGLSQNVDLLRVRF